MIDPRLAGIERRLSEIRRIVVFSSGKGGVGKSICSSVASLVLAGRGYRVGLLDLDFHGASTHIFLGAELGFPEENHGILPLELESGVRFMSIAAFTGEDAVPLRGGDVSNALIELLTVTVWGTLDYLIVDMPPGIGDEVLDLIRFMRDARIVVVTSPSIVSLKVVERLLRMYVELQMDVAGILENMSAYGARPGGPNSLSEKLEVPLLGSIPFCPDLESSIGSTRALSKSQFYVEMERIISHLDL